MLVSVPRCEQAQTPRMFDTRPTDEPVDQCLVPAPVRLRLENRRKHSCLSGPWRSPEVERGASGASLGPSWWWCVRLSSPPTTCPVFHQPKERGTNQGQRGQCALLGLRLVYLLDPGRAKLSDSGGRVALTTSGDSMAFGQAVPGSNLLEDFLPHPPAEATLSPSSVIWGDRVCDLENPQQTLVPRS